MYYQVNQSIKSIKLTRISYLFSLLTLLIMPHYAYSQNFNAQVPEQSIPDSRLNNPVYTDPFGTELDITSPTLIEPLPSIKVEEPVAPEETPPPTKSKEPIVPKETKPKIKIPLGFFMSLRFGVNTLLSGDFGFDVHNNLRIRTSLNYLFNTFIIQSQENPADKFNVALTILWPELLLDIYPSASSSFKFTLGVAYPGYKIEAGVDASPHKKGTTNGTTYISYPNPVAPIVGFGWDYGRNSSYHFISTLEMGVAWAGKPKVTRVVTDPKTDLFADFESEIKTVVDKYKKFAEFIPWFNISFGMKF